MQMRACASSRAAAKCDWLSGAHYLVCFDECLVEVAVDGLKTVGMAQDHVVAISARLVVGETHLAVECGVDCVVRSDLKVDALVHSAELCAITVVGGHSAGARHMVAGHVDYLRIGHV